MTTAPEGGAAAADRRLWRVGLFLVVAAGAVFRAALVLPLTRLVAQSDAVMTGLTAFKVLRGLHPVFYSGVRLGALESYLHAVVFKLLGVSIGTLLVTPFLVGVALVLVFALFARELLKDGRALFAAALVAIPSPPVSGITSEPFGYDLTLFLSAGTLWFAARAVNGKTVALSAWLCGLCAGLALWNNLLTLAVTLPALLWIAFRPPARASGVRFAPRFGVGFVIGALPFIAYNIRFPLATFRSVGYPIRPARSLWQIADNARYFVSYDLREIFFATGSKVPRFDPAVDSALSGVIAFELVLAGVLAGGRLWVALRRRASAPDGGLRGAAAWEDLLPILIVAATAAVNVFSWAGGVRFGTSRYAVTVALAAPVLLASLYDRVGKSARWTGAVLLAAVLVYYVGVTRYPALDSKARLKREAESRLVDFLERERIAFVVGDYWDVYSLNFLTHERVLAIPTYADTGRYRSLLPLRPARFALVAWRPGFVSEWARVARVPGRVLSFGAGLEALVPSPNPPSPEGARDVARDLERDFLAIRKPGEK